MKDKYPPEEAMLDYCLNNADAQQMPRLLGYVLNTDDPGTQVRNPWEIDVRNPYLYGFSLFISWNTNEARDI